MLKYVKVPKDTYDSMVLLMAELKEDNRELELTRLRNERRIEEKSEEVNELVECIENFLNKHNDYIQSCLATSAEVKTDTIVDNVDSLDYCYTALKNATADSSDAK